MNAFLPVFRNIFPTPLYEFTHPVSEDLIRRILQEREDDPVGVNRSNSELEDSWHSQLNAHEWPETQTLIAAILTYMSGIEQARQYNPKSKLIVNSMWANVSGLGGFNKNHIHPNGLWSGVYYLQTPPACGDLVFTDPRPAAVMTVPQYHSSELPLSERHSFHVTPELGNLYIFPSWLPHEVNMNLSQILRISVAFEITQITP